MAAAAEAGSLTLACGHSVLHTTAYGICTACRDTVAVVWLLLQDQVGACDHAWRGTACSM